MSSKFTAEGATSAAKVAPMIVIGKAELMKIADKAVKQVTIAPDLNHLMAQQVMTIEALRLFLEEYNIQGRFVLEDELLKGRFDG